MKEQKSDEYLYQPCRFIAVVFQFAILLQRQKVPAEECHIRNVAPRFLTFRGLHAKVLDAHRESGKPAMYEHTCQYCCKLRGDHVKTPASWTYLAIRAFQSRKILCHGFSQFVWLGGRGQIEATDENEHPSFPGLFYKFFCGQRRNMQQESQFC